MSLHLLNIFFSFYCHNLSTEGPFKKAVVLKLLWWSVVKTWPSSAGGVSLIPGQETKIPCAMQQGQKIFKKGREEADVFISLKL